MAEYVDDSNTALQPAVGFALCYYAYSTWQGTCLFLEDIYVQETFRAQGVGMALMTRCIREASQRNCARVQFQALDWNTPALEFYKKVGASETRDWIPIRFEREAIAGFLEKYDKR
jgi:GNAT superfamily N-acetyltransferase